MFTPRGFQYSGKPGYNYLVLIYLFFNFSNDFIRSGSLVSYASIYLFEFQSQVQ